MPWGLLSGEGGSALSRLLARARARACEATLALARQLSTNLGGGPVSPPCTLEAGAAKALVVVKLDRLSRSMLDVAALMATAQKQNWARVGPASGRIRRGSLRTRRVSPDVGLCPRTRAS